MTSNKEPDWMASVLTQSIRLSIFSFKLAVSSSCPHTRSGEYAYQEYQSLFKAFIVGDLQLVILVARHVISIAAKV